MITYERIQPYSSDYLRDLIYRKRLNADEISVLVSEMKNWLYESVRKDTETTYYWSSASTMVYSGNKKAFPDVLYFKYESDLLVFRLRWGIQG